MTPAKGAEQRSHFVGYLRSVLGDAVLGAIEEAGDIRAGERVLYRLRGGTTAARQEPSAQDLEDQRSRLARLAESTGATGVTFEPPGSSGSPDPRLVDLPGAGILWDVPLRQYLASDEPWPEPDFPLLWALGVLQATDEILLYLDFIHPTVKAVFTASYDVDYRTAEERARLVDGFTQFRARHRDLRQAADADPQIVWAKIVQVDRDPVAGKIKRIP